MRELFRLFVVGEPALVVVVHVRYSIVSSEATADAENARSRLAIGLPISIPASTPSRHWSRCGFTVKIYLDRFSYAFQSEEMAVFFRASKRNLGFQKLADIRG